MTEEKASERQGPRKNLTRGHGWSRRSGDGGRNNKTHTGGPGWGKNNGVGNIKLRKWDSLETQERAEQKRVQNGREAEWIIEDVKATKARHRWPNRRRGNTNNERSTIPVSKKNHGKETRQNA